MLRALLGEQRDQLIVILDPAGRVAYRDRGDVLDSKHRKRVTVGAGLLSPSVVIDGRVIGTWRRTLARSSVEIALDSFGKVTRAQRHAIASAAARYASFLGLEMSPHDSMNP